MQWNLIRLSIAHAQVWSRRKMASSSKSSLVGVIQMTSTPNKEENYQQALGLINIAKAKGAHMVFLPECADYVGESQKNSLSMSESLNGDTVTKYKKLAKKLDIWLSLGGIHEQPSNFAKDGRLRNTHIIIDNSGKIQGQYSKTHLFDVDIKDGIRLKETDMTEPGMAIGPPISTAIGNVGLGICYDVRFPELSISLAQQGADILTYPSAFTVQTGQVHWKVLMQSRAIENQCYVIAAAQVGRHHAKRSSYGHTMVVDPWGTVLAECQQDQPDVCFAEIDMQYLHKRRTEMPVWQHRRHDLYGHIQTVISSSIGSSSQYEFGQYTVPATCVFYKTALSYAFVNKKPVLPGHVLICPLRVVDQFSDLTPAEVADVFSCAQKVSTQVQQHYKGTAFTMAVQNGKDAGQTVKHFHVHVLPRKPGDLERNDDIYDKLEHHDTEVTEGKWRSEEDMAKEAATLRTLFN